MFANKQLIQAAQQHAGECYPRESCGVVIGGAYIPVENKHESPNVCFRISPIDYIRLSVIGKIQAVVHSHPDGPDHPSVRDMECQQAETVPWLIIPTNSAPFWFGDQVPIAPYEGRVFKTGVFDCYSLIRDWYRQEKGITLIDVPRNDTWWATGSNLYMENLKKAGFRQLGEDENLQRGDGLLASILAPGVINHAGIYLGANQFLHHLTGRLSKIELITVWYKYFTIKVRYTR